MPNDGGCTRLDKVTEVIILPAGQFLDVRTQTRAICSNCSSLWQPILNDVAKDGSYMCNHCGAAILARLEAEKTNASN